MKKQRQQAEQRPEGAEGAPAPAATIQSPGAAVQARHASIPIFIACGVWMRCVRSQADDFSCSVQTTSCRMLCFVRL